ncbi:MAG: N-acetylmuramoyl-L-alanine amidase [Chitinophagaceae bacterium]
MNKILVPVLLLISVYATAQNKPFIRLVDVPRDNIKVRNPVQYLSGSTCKDCLLSINGTKVKVYPTGAFAYELNLELGLNVFNIVATAAPNAVNRKLTYQYSKPVRDTVKTFEIDSFEVFPKGNLVVQAGDRISFRVKALTGCNAMVNGNIPLFELATSDTNRMPGIYQGEYRIKETDTFMLSPVRVTIANEEGKTLSKISSTKISMMSPWGPDMLVTRGRLAFLLFGLGEDRLGGAKIGYIDSLIPLRMIGRVDSNYKVQLSKYRTAYVPADVVSFLPRGTFTPTSLTGNWKVWGDSLYDYVSVGLSSRLPYQAAQQIDPAKIVVDIFGATNNSNWIIQMENVKEIKNVYYEQTEDEVYRVTIDLKHKQHWGYQIYYNNNNLVIKVRRQPADLALQNIKIAVDAGHGGSNSGAEGLTGSSEKALTLAVSLKLQKKLEELGAKVIMTRTTEKFVDNKDRILFYRDSLPDLLVSIHLNSAGDPIHVSGASTYYRHIGFRDLSHAIYKRMLETGLKEFGNTGSFNFMLNSPTEYPNALIELLFLSNPEDEMKILDQDFQQQLVDKIVMGIQDFLEGAKSGF